ncbi:RIO1 family protein, partial [Ostertagia ostertagi]
ESAVLNAVNNESGERFAIKVYKTSLTEFKNRSEYVKDDFRFKNPRGVLKIWAEREFMNLSRMIKCELPCPVPIKLKRHLLLMSLIGENGAAAPRLKNIDWEFSTVEERKDIFSQVINIMNRMYRDCKLVHGDLSEFNLLLSEGKVEQFSEENRANQVNKSKPADFEWAAYNAERKELRDDSPARDYN